MESNGRPSGWGRCAVAIASATLGLLLFAPAAGADLVVCGPGSGAGQCTNPQGVAVDRTAGFLYVADDGNRRVDIFDADDGIFLRAFGWDVAPEGAPGDTAEDKLEVCTSICQAGVAGAGTGQLNSPTGVAVDNDPASPAFHDVYLYDGTNSRVQRFTPSGGFVHGFGYDVIPSGAAGSGDLSSGSTTVSSVVTTKKAFRRGQEISGVGIPAGTTIVNVTTGEGANSKLALSKAATASGSGVALAVAEGVGNLAQNEQQTITLNATGGNFKLTFNTTSPTAEGTTGNIAFNAPASGAGSVQATLEGLPNIGAGNVGVSGPSGGPYTVEFKGSRFADTNVAQLVAAAGTPDLNGPASSKIKIDTTVDGTAFEVCGVASGCEAGVQGTGAGQFNSQPKLDLAPGGVVYVADVIGGGNRRVQKFDHEGNPVASCSSLEAGKLEPTDKSDPDKFGLNLLGFAVDSGGAFYLASAGGRPVEKYDASCTQLGSFHESFNIQTLALDAADNLFVADVTGPSGSETAIYRYDPSHTLLHVLYGNGTLKRRPASLAPYQSANGDLFAVETPSYPDSLKRVLQIATEPPGPVVSPDPEQTDAKPIGNTTATLNTKINPEGKATTYRFEYVDDASYDTEGGFSSPETKIAPVPDEAVIPGATPTFAPELFRLSAASKAVGCPNPEAEASLPGSPCLLPATEYHLRAVATNADAPGGRNGPEVSFETKEPFEIRATWAGAVGIDAAQLGAEVNPLKIPAEGRFEYVEEATCLKDLAGLGAGHCFDHAQTTGDIDFGSGEAPAVRSVQLSSLKANTTYRYRVTVEDFYKSELGEEHAFTTFAVPEAPRTSCPNQAFRVGASAPLPDCRAYEMVSPVDKEGGEIRVGAAADFAAWAEIVQSAAVVPEQGRGLAYSAYRAFGDAASAPYSSQYLASRHPLGDLEEGWRSHGISPPRGAPLTLLVQDTQYKAFSEDLGLALLQTDSEPPLAPGAIAGFPALYQRDNATERYQAICPVKAEGFYRKPQGASADWGTIVFRTAAKLSEEASGAKLEEAPISQTYACREGQVEVVSVLPPAAGGKASETSSGAGTVFAVDSLHRYDNVHNAVSTDAGRIYWSDSGNQSYGPGKIYLRERPLAEGAECSGPQAPCTVAVSEAVGGAGGEARAEFWTASPEGSVAIFSFSEGALQGNLYRFEAETGTTSQIAEGVTGLAGWSEDASRLYFVSTKALAPGAEAGKPNLYFHEAGSGSELVAALPGGTDTITKYCDVAKANPHERCTRASTDGSRFVFASRDPLSGYDNRDAQSGKADSEVFLYDAAADGGEGALTCVSCNPSGGRPAGREVEVYGGSIWPIAARIPPWAHSLYAPRALSEDGRRLFFESFDALLPTDTNGAQDVYQWEEAGKGDCDADNSTPGPTYFPQNGGCLALISSGRSPRDSEFADASADGHDVFFKTAAGLLPQDPGLLDLYDAREGGGFPAPPEEKPACEGEACQSPPAPPEAPSPASESFHGAKPRCPGPGKRAAKRSAAARKKGRCPAKKHKRKGQRQGRSAR